jgi:AcrR family transcriptional regulator
MRKRKEDADRTRLNLLDAAQAVFLAKGYAATTLEDIAQAAAVTRGAVYHHFKDGKAEILNAICFDRYGKLGSVFENLNANELTAAQKLRQSLMAYFDQLANDREFSDLQYILIYKTELTEEVMGGMQAKVESTRALIKHYAALIETIVAQSQHRAGLSSNEIAKILICFQSGLTNLWLADRDAVSLKGEAPRMMDALLEKLLGIGRVQDAP